MGSVFFSLIVFVIVVEVLKRSPGLLEISEGGFEILRIVFYAIAISMVFLVSLVHAFMLKGTTTDDINRIASKLTAVTVVMTGMAEVPLILGFILFVGFGYHTDFYILGFVTLYLMVRHFPYYGQWEKFARSRMGPKWPSGPVGG
jgi:hypothetical protein